MSWSGRTVSRGEGSGRSGAPSRRRSGRAGRPGAARSARWPHSSTQTRRRRPMRRRYGRSPQLCGTWHIIRHASRSPARALGVGLIALAGCHHAAPVHSAPPEQHFVARGPTARVEVLDWGGAATPLVFLPGLGNTAHVFEAFAPRLTNRYRVLAITPRGFGASTSGGGSMTLDTVIDDIVAVLDSLRLGPAVIAGHSLGGDFAT